MKLPTIKCAKFGAEYKFFLASKQDPGFGEWLKEEQFIPRFLENLKTGSASRCEDPRCNRLLDKRRADQRYCDDTCGKRHRARVRYQQDNGMPEEQPAVVVGESDEQIREQLDKELTRGKAEANLRPCPIPERLPDGSYRMQSVSNRIAVAKTKRDPLYNMIDDLRAKGYELTDFWPDQRYEVMTEYFKTEPGVLPSDERLADMCAQDVRAQRLTDEQAKRDAERLARERCAALFPNMDVVRGDGSIGGKAPS